MPEVVSWLQAVWKISRDGYQGSGWRSPSCCSWRLLLEANDDDVDLVCEVWVRMLWLRFADEKTDIYTRVKL